MHEVQVPYAIRYGLEEIISVRTPDFLAIANAAGLDPKNDFRGARLESIDFGTSDLGDFDFSNADLRGCDFSKVKSLPRCIDGANIDGAVGLSETKNE